MVSTLNSDLGAPTILDVSYGWMRRIRVETGVPAANGATILSWKDGMGIGNNATGTSLVSMQYTTPLNTATTVTIPASSTVKVTVIGGGGGGGAKGRGGTAFGDGGVGGNGAVATYTFATSSVTTMTYYVGGGGSGGVDVGDGGGGGQNSYVTIGTTTIYAGGGGGGGGGGGMYVGQGGTAGIGSGGGSGGVGGANAPRARQEGWVTLELPMGRLELELRHTVMAASAASASSTAATEIMDSSSWRLLHRHQPSTALASTDTRP